MRKIILSLFFLAFLGLFAQEAYSQKLGFVSSGTIRKFFPDAKQADQRIQSIVDDWKRSLDEMEQTILDMEYELKKNRLVWSDEEKRDKEKELENKKKEKITFAKLKFEAGGEYDLVVKTVMSGVEEKIYAAIQEIAANDGYDMIFDKDLYPMPYVNFKYDLTVKTLRKLGVDVQELEKNLQEKINTDPRNKQTTSAEPPRKRSRERSQDDREIKREGDGGEVSPEGTTTTPPNGTEPSKVPDVVPENSNPGK